MTLLLFDTTYIGDLTIVTLDQWEPSITILPAIWVRCIAIVSSIRAVSCIVRSKMEYGWIGSFDTTRPIGSVHISTSRESDIACAITVSIVGSIVWEWEEWCEWSWVLPSIPDSSFPLTTSRKSVSWATRTIGPWSRSCLLSLPWERVPHTIVREKSRLRISSEEPPWLPERARIAIGWVTSCPYLSSDRDVSTSTSRVRCYCCRIWIVLWIVVLSLWIRVVYSRRPTCVVLWGIEPIPWISIRDILSLIVVPCVLCVRHREVIIVSRLRSRVVCISWLIVLRVVVRLSSLRVIAIGIVVRRCWWYDTWRWYSYIDNIGPSWSPSPCASVSGTHEESRYEDKNRDKSKKFLHILSVIKKYVTYTQYRYFYFVNSILKESSIFSSYYLAGIAIPITRAI